MRQNSSSLLKLGMSIGFILLTTTGWTAEILRPLVVCDDVADPATLDPQKEFTEKNHIIVQQIYDGLVRFDPNGNIEPALAVSWERIDPLRMRFHLRRGVSFHNGEIFNAGSVKFSIERYLKPETGFPALGFISSLDKAEIVDDYTIDIVTKFPDGILINRLAGFVLIVPPKYLKENGEDALHGLPVGTGPFKFVKWEKGKNIALEANENYWMKGYPKVSSLTFVFYPIEEQIDKLIEGKIDLVTELPGTRTSFIMESGKAKIIKQPTYITYTTSMNISSGPLANLNVRRALNYAIDKQELIHYDAFENGDSIATVTMPGEVGHNQRLKPYSFNIEKARNLLKEAGYGNGFPLKALVKSQAERAFKIIKVQLEKVGVKITGEVVPDSEMVKKMASEKWDIMFGNCPDPMAHSFFIQAIFFYSKSPFSLMHSPPYDQQLESMVMAMDPAQQSGLGEKLDAYIYENALALFTYQRIRTYAAKKTLHFKPYVTGMPYFYSTEFMAGRPAGSGPNKAENYEGKSAK